MRKKRILFVGESSYLDTGFANYYREVIGRIFDTGKYEILELGRFGPAGDPRERTVRWPYKPIMPCNDQEKKAYDSNRLNHFGAYKFEETLLEFKPDIVSDISDWWHLEYQGRSPLRKYFQWVIMPTVDAAPQQNQWLHTYSSADRILTYSDWSGKLLKQQAPEIRWMGSASPGADEVFQPVPNKKRHRAAVGVAEDCFIIGTVMRNQGRKLYPQLLRDFRKFLDRAPAKIAKKSFLYIHTCWPDIGWNIPELINEYKIGHKVVMTYRCKSCQATYPGFFSDSVIHCRKCKKKTASFPHSHHDGVSREVLAGVMNCFDVYVQYSACEGFGMPQVEAAACGVPVMSVDYSAMSDVVRKVSGFPIKVSDMTKEPETGRWMALPDGNDFVEKLINFFNQPQPMRDNLGYKARKNARKNFSYDQAAQLWMETFDGLPENPRKWNAPIDLHRPNINIPKGLTDSEFVDWLFVNVAGRPDLLGTYPALRLLRDITWKATIGTMGGSYLNEPAITERPNYTKFSREDAIKNMLSICQDRNHWETLRVKH